MPKGVDSSRWPQRDLSRRIKQEAASQKEMFGVVLGPQDSGERSGVQPHVPPDATIESNIKWNQRAAPVGGVFEGAPADAIRLAQMATNKEHAMAALMQHPPAGGGASKMVDLGMGRLSTGKSYPVHSYRDERIMLKPEGTADRASQFHESHEAAGDNVPHPDQE
jgi:hypothetical protein